MTDLSQLRWQDPETRAKEMAMGVVSNLGAYATANSREDQVRPGTGSNESFSAYFVIEDPIHAMAHTIFRNEAEITSIEDDTGEVIAMGGLRLHVRWDQSSDGNPVGVAYTSRDLN